MNPPRILTPIRRLLHLSRDDANHGLLVRDRSSSGIVGHPANVEFGTAMPDLQRDEVDFGLLALTDHELQAGGEGRVQRAGLRAVHGCVALRTGADEGVDALGVVGEVRSEDGFCGDVVVVGDEFAVEASELIGFRVGHALLLLLGGRTALP